MSAKVESLEAKLQEKDVEFAEKLRSLTEEHETKQATLTDKLDSFKASFEAEKQKIEQDARD